MSCLYNEEDDDGASVSSTELCEDLVQMEVDNGNKLDQWDCESILSTYSNTSNRPTLIREARHLKQVNVDRKTGLPEGVLKHRGIGPQELKLLPTEDDEQSVSTRRRSAPIQRPKDETTEEKRKRKADIKSIRKDRRQEKKANQLAFKDEKKIQTISKLNVTQNLPGIKLL